MFYRSLDATDPSLLWAQSDLPLRPRFAWDIRSVPWTDGRGNQDQYASAVALWKAFHDKLPDANSNKIPKDLQGIMLQSQLYGRARDLCKSIPDETIQSEDGSEAIVNKIYQRDPLAVVSDVYQDFITLLNTKRGNNESFQNFGTRFKAQVSKFSSHCDAVKLPEALTAFMLLANSGVDSTQRISVLAASAPRDNSFDSNLPSAMMMARRKNYFSKKHCVFQTICMVMRSLLLRRWQRDTLDLWLLDLPLFLFLLKYLMRSRN